MLLHCKGRAERRRKLARPLARVGHQPLPDRISALCARDSDGQIAQLQLNSSGQQAGTHSAEEVNRHGPERDADVEKRSALPRDSQANPVDGHRRRKCQTARVEQSELEAGRRLVLDPTRVGFDGDDDVLLVQGNAALDSEDERQNARVLAEPDSETSADIDGWFRTGKIASELLQSIEELVGSEESGVDVNGIGGVEHHVLQHVPDRRGANRIGQQALDGRCGQREARHDVDHSFDQRARHTGRLDVLRDSVDGNEPQARAIEVPAASDGVRDPGVGAEPDLDAPSACW